MNILVRKGRRVENLGENVKIWSKNTGKGASFWDLCIDHACVLDSRPHSLNKKLIPYQHYEPSGEDGRGGDLEHPPYTHEQCYLCKVQLID